MKEIACFVRDCSLGDWFILHQMAKNLNKSFFADFLLTMARQINHKIKEANKMKQLGVFGMEDIDTMNEIVV